MLLLLSVSCAYAVDIAALGRVSVLMQKSEVLKLLGEPDKVADMDDLTVDMYMVQDAAHFVSAGYFYENSLVLAGYSYVFRSNIAIQAVNRMKSRGFDVLDKKRDYIRLAGKDIDTGRPIIVTITDMDYLTTITVFEKGFYERRANQ